MNSILAIWRLRRMVSKHYQAFGRKLARQRALCQGNLTSTYLKANSHWDGLERRETHAG